MLKAIAHETIFIVRIFALALLLFFAFSAHAEFIGVKTNSQRYYFKQVGNRFTYKDGQTDRAFTVKSCNKKIFKEFWQSIEKKFKLRKHLPKDVNPRETIRINYKKKFYKIGIHTEFGILLQTPQTLLQNLVLEKNVNCNDK